MTEEIDLYYFEPGEVDNPENLKDILEGMGEKNDISTPLFHEARKYARKIRRDWEEVYDRELYLMENESSAQYLETDQGIFILSDSDFLSENSRALKSRSTENV